MIKRIFQLDRELDGSIFLFGARQTGKTTILHQQFPDAIFIDLLDTSVKGRFLRRPTTLYEMLGGGETFLLHLCQKEGFSAAQQHFMRC